MSLYQAVHRSPSSGPDADRVPTRLMKPVMSHREREARVSRLPAFPGKCASEMYIKDRSCPSLDTHLLCNFSVGYDLQSLNLPIV